jgi:hypothetical protein
MDATLWTGNDSATRTISNLNFQPDLVWCKSRTNNYFHNIFDAVRGAGSTKQLASNTTGAEGDGGYAGLYGYLSSFNSNGFTATAGTGAGNDKYIWWNDNSDNYVAWNWKAGGSTVTNNVGSISSQVSVNSTAGFSIVTYTGNGVASTVGHGLGVAPSMIIVKNRTTGTSDVWLVQHSSLGATKYIILNRTDAAGTASTAWNDTAPTSSVFSLGSLADVNRSTNTYVAYCWAQVAGFSQFGSYTGNGSSDGPFIYTGFRPSFWMVKRTDTTGEWFIQDTTRNTSNLTNLYLYPNDSAAEQTNGAIDLLSNGFKLRNSYAPQNASGGTYIYMAFAENPFKFSNAR